MAESSRRFRNSTSRSIAASSAIALALGGLSVVGPGPLAPSAAATSYTGGIRDKSGAVEKDAQQASDLPAGECVVSSGEPSGSQAGFSWNTLEPSATSPDKKAWGLSVSFDNSKDRTFADWYFTNTGNLGALLNTGEVPSMEPGQTFLDKSVTHKADESIVIDGVRVQRNLNLFAELTEEKVKQFASATADNPVRYAWQGHYTKDHTGNLYATQGTSSAFGATVNPWPSENIECNPITVSWETAEVSEKHVIVPGEETKVGTINVPAVQNGGTDDSMSRMVVEAYDGNGKFIGTTDPSVSGGEQLLRVDEATGDIFFTWPEYRGTDLATDKNVNFSVLAKPRTVDQLQNAVENNIGEEGKTFDSSNSLDRYSKANVIDSKAFSLDDTEYHTPKYDKTDASIISGVDSATGPLATEPQKVTFTQIPDLIKELAKEKGDGGFEAKVALDEKYVYDGWTVEMDEDYNVTVTAPKEPNPGTFARPVVTVEYSNGSTDELELLVVVDPNNTQVTDLVRPGLTKGTIGDDLTAQVGTKSIMKGHKPVHPAKFEIDESTVPEGWTVTVDETGKVTAKADDTVAPGTIITPKVKATYPDQTTDEIETQFQAIVDIKVPDYDTVTNKPGTNVSLTPTVPERGLSGNTTDEAPKRYTFEGGKTEYTVEDDSGKWTVKIDETTGKITTSIPRTAPEGYILNVPVLAHYENQEKPQQVKGTVVVLKSDIAPTYDVQVTGPNQAVNHKVEDAPKGSKFSFGTDDQGAPIIEQEVDGWKYKVDPDTGVVSSTPPADAKPGDKNTVNVTVKTPDGSTPEVPVTTVVKLTNNWEAEPTYPVETVFPGETATLPVALDIPENVNVAKENPYKLGDLPEGWTVSIDDNGVITATAPADAEPGSQVEIPVTVTYEDGSTDTAKAVVNVVDVPTRELPFDVEYKFDDTIPAGEYKVETEGAPGEEKQNKDGTWEQTTAPKNEVVLVGTKPAESAKDVTWKVPIPYPTEVRENPDLKPGEMKTVQEGENGEKTYTAKFTSKGSEAQVAEEETTKEPVTRIIEVGPGISDQELTSKKTQEVPFEIEYVYDDTLESGEQVVDEEGVPGEQTITSTQKIKDGKPDGEPSINIEETKAPKKAKIRIGTKTTGSTTESVESEVPFGVKIEFDPNMPAGESEVTTPGKPGKKKVTIERDITNSKPGEPKISEEITDEPVDQVIKVGTKPSEASEKVTWTAQVPFDVETRPNPELKPGEIKVVQEGVPGEKTYTADFAAKGDQATVTPEEKQTKDPVKEIIEYGPAIEDGELVTKVKKPVPFETEVILDDTLESGKQVVDQQGELGTEVVTSTQKLVDGKPSGEPTITTEETKAPKKAIIRVGSMTDGTHVVEEKQPIPFDTKIEYDPTIPAGEYKVVTPGKAGEKTVTITETIVNSKVTDTDRKEAITSEPVTEVIKVGTKQATATDKVEWAEPIPFSTVVRPNPALAPGEVKTVQEGKDGKVAYSATFTGTNGDATTTEETSRTEPVQEIIEYGPRLGDQEVTHQLTRLVEFDTEVIYDDTLEEGKQVVEQGEFGVETVTTSQKLVDGKPSGEPTETVNRTKEPKNAVIRIGTKKPAEPTEPAPVPSPSVEPLTFPIPFPVRYEYDPNLPAGEEEVLVEGTPGSKTVQPKLQLIDGQPVWTVEEIDDQAPVERVVRIGTKQPEQQQPEVNPFTWTTEIPFSTTIRPNADLAPGETKVVQEGSNGRGSYSVNPETGEITVLENTKPVERIVEYGPKDDVAVTKVTRPVPFETDVIYDPELPEGAQRIEQGEVGEEVITTTQEFKDGQLVGEPVTTTEQTRAPKNAVIRIGTKQTPQDASVTEVDVTPSTQLIFDPSLKPGEQAVVSEGTPGTVRVTTVDGETTVETVKDPMPRIVRVGSMQPDALTWLEPVPFGVITRENPDLPAGEHRIIQQGQPGLVQHVGEDSTTLTEAKDHVVEIGTAKGVYEKRETVTEPTPFKTIFVEDETLAAGVVKVDTQGVNGSQRTTKVWKLQDGQIVGEPEVSTETLSEPENLIIRVGTGKPAEEKPQQPEDPKVPEDEKTSSAERCVANAFAANSPLLWLLPIGVLGAIGYGVNELYGPQINQAAGALNARWEAFVRENTPDFGHGHRGMEKPEWMREAEAQANALNQQFNQRFAGYGEQLRPVGIALGAIAAVALTGTLIAQACREEGFDNGMTVLGSTERKLDFGASSEKADGAQAGSSSETRSSRKDGSSAK